MFNDYSNSRETATTNLPSSGHQNTRTNSKKIGDIEIGFKDIRQNQPTNYKNRKSEFDFWIKKYGSFDYGPKPIPPEIKVFNDIYFVMTYGIDINM